MTGRIPFGLLTLLTALVCLPIQAQDQMGPPPGYGVQPAGFHAFQQPGGPGQYSGLPSGYQRTPGRGQPGAPPPTIFEELPDDLGFAYEDSPLGKMLTNSFRHAWFRNEYLLWNISSPGHVLLGEQNQTGITFVGHPVFGQSPTSAVAPGIPFNIAVNGLSGTGQVPGLDNFSSNNMNGYRGTFGLPVPVGTLEVSSFLLAPSSDTFNGDELIRPQIIAVPAVIIGGPGVNGQDANFIIQAALRNGARSNNDVIAYDVSYQAKLTTSAWGTEANFVADSVDPNSLFQFRPLFGARYFNLRDRLLQNGRYHETDANDPTITNTIRREINSSGNNDVAGPQIGVRAELTHSRFLIGVEPKVTLGLNSWKTTLDNSNVFSSQDTGQSLLARGTTFSPLVDVKFYSNVGLTKYLSAYVAYNYLWVGNVNRSYNDITYNRNSQTNTSDFHIKREYSNAVLQGLSFGLEFKY
jgi:hypothetical protein